MASTKPVPTKAAAAAAKSARKGKPPAKRGPAARVIAGSDAAKEPLAAARGMPGWRGARTLVGEALAAGDTAVLLEARGQSVSRRRRDGAAWQPPVPLAGDDAVATFLAFRKLATVAGPDEPGYVVSAWKLPRRSCRVAARATSKGEQVLVLLGPALPRPERPRIGRLIAAALGCLVPRFLRRTPPPPDRDPTLPDVELEVTGPDAEARQAAVAEADGYVPACDLVAAAVRDRANTIIIEGGPQGVTVQFDVDGVGSPAPQLDAAEVVAVVGVLKAAAGIDPKGRGPQSGKVTAQVHGKPWPCTISAQRGTAGERVHLTIDHGRPKFKTLTDTGMSDDVAGRVQELLKLESGLVLVAAPRRGGLSTLCDAVIGAADRLMRDFVVLEDAAAPRPEIQNVKAFRWDSRQGEKPATALDAALREYPHVIATSDLEDKELARRLVAQAGAGRLVIMGIRGADAADGLARLVALGADPQALARVLVGAVGSRLVRKLCPKCRQEYFPAVDTMAKLSLDPDAFVTLFRAPPSGCPVCTGTGYLGRTAACELVAGPTLQAGLAKAADAAVLRQAAARDGTVTVWQDAGAKAGRGVTSAEEVQRVFRKA